MSHFSVLVITEQEPTEELLEKVMLPWHEFECTGLDNEYVLDVDRTDEAKKEFAERDDKDEGFAEWFEGCYGTKIVRSEGEIDKAGDHKYGYCLVDGEGNLIRYIDRTNPNRKWDYWRIGGRYRAKLQAKALTTSGRATDPSWEWTFNGDEKIPEGLDVCKRGDLDLERMKQERVQARRDWIKESMKKAAITSYDSYLTGFRLTEAYKKVWLTLDEPRPRGGDYINAMIEWLKPNHDVYDIALAKAVAGLWDAPEIPEGQTVEEWINSAPPITAFAVVKDGKWYEQGEMGWWACVSNEDENWEDKFNELFGSIPDEHYISVLDCHI